MEKWKKATSKSKNKSGYLVEKTGYKKLKKLKIIDFVNNVFLNKKISPLFPHCFF